MMSWSGISFDRVDHDHADTMEDCRKIEDTGREDLQKPVLCNRQQTEFLPPDDAGRKALQDQVSVRPPWTLFPALSFADDGHMAACLNTVPGSVSALELLV